MTAWLTAAYQRSKRLPRLSEALRGVRRPASRGDARQGVSVDQVATINALLGGRDLRGAGTDEVSSEPINGGE